MRRKIYSILRPSTSSSTVINTLIYSHSLCSLFDITELKELEEALKLSDSAVARGLESCCWLVILSDKMAVVRSLLAIRHFFRSE